MNAMFDSLDPLTGLNEQDSIVGLSGEELIIPSDSNAIDRNVDETLVEGDRTTPSEQSSTLVLASTPSSPIASDLAPPAPAQSTILYPTKALDETLVSSEGDRTTTTPKQNSSLVAVNTSNLPSTIATNLAPSVPAQSTILNEPKASDQTAVSSEGDRTTTLGQSSTLVTTNTSTSPSLIASNLAPPAPPAAPTPPKLTDGAPFYKLDDSNGVNGINSRGLGLTGSGVAIGQVEIRRPGKPGDDEAKLVNSVVNPEKVFFQAGKATKNEAKEIGTGHAIQVAGVMIAKQNRITGTGVAPDAKLYSGGIVEGDTSKDLITAQNIAQQNGVRAINLSYGFRPLPQDKMPVIAQLRGNRDWWGFKAVEMDSKAESP